MSTQRLLYCALTCLIACACSVPARRAPASTSPADPYRAGIARIEQTDPGSPALLNARLAYGEYLLSAAPGPCAQRVVLAQEQLGAVNADAKTRVLFPDGWARAADLQYRLHLARAECVDKSNARDDLLAAIEAARRAVELYRNSFDYRSMVIMQFDAAVALHRLGDSAAGIAALEAALDMDREYGFADDAQQNYGLLLSWRGEKAGAAQVARLMQDFPKRRVVLKFGWHPADAHITLEGRRDCLEDDLIVHSHATAALERHIAAGPSGGWSVTDAITRYAPGVWPTEKDARTAQLYFPPLRIPALDFKVSRTGEFEGVTNSKAFSSWLTARTDGLIKADAPAGDVGGSTTGRAVEATGIALSPGMLEAATTENYQLETAMWIGATLDQGVWYGVSAPLTLPGISRIVVQQHLEFAFTRWVPCIAAAGPRSCVEIVIHATPDAQALHAVLADIPSPFPDTSFLGYNASIEARIVVDPATLLSYAREERIYWYAAFGKEPGGYHSRVGPPFGYLELRRPLTRCATLMQPAPAWLDSVSAAATSWLIRMREETRHDSTAQALAIGRERLAPALVRAAAPGPADLAVAGGRDFGTLRARSVNFALPLAGVIDDLVLVPLLLHLVLKLLPTEIRLGYALRSRN